MKTQINFKQIVKIGGLLLFGILLGWLFFGGSSAEQPVNMEQHIQETHTDEQGNIVYTCSMHPQIRENKPGNCPICGMELIPVESTGDENFNPQALTMTPVAIKLADVATTEAVKKVAVKQLRMPGKVAVDEQNISAIPAHYSGRVEELYINFEGAYVEKHEKLASVYSPELITAQKGLLQAYQFKHSNPALYHAAIQKLKNWKISEEQIQEIIQTGEPKNNFIIRAHRSGYVLKKYISAGDHIMTGHPMFKVANLSEVWVVFQAYENNIAGLDTGEKVNFTVAALPGKRFEAEVTYIDPMVSEMSRTITVRTKVDNETRLLKPNMLASGIIKATLNDGKPVLQIPASAVLWTGKRSIVYVKVPDRKETAFVAREVVLGPKAGNNHVVLNGLEAGDKVVVQGNFVIDAAAQLAGKRSMMNREPSNTPGMPEMKMNSSTTDTIVHQHSKHLSLLVKQYLQVKNALVKDNFEQAKLHFKNLKKEVLKSSEMNNHPNHTQMHKTHHAAMVEAITLASNAKNLEQFRSAFAAISENLIKTVQNQNYGQQTLYIQFCPMAKNGKGARWISKQEKIANPYMGQKMPDCGEVKEILGKEQ